MEIWRWRRDTYAVGRVVHPDRGGERVAQGEVGGVAGGLEAVDGSGRVALRQRQVGDAEGAQIPEGVEGGGAVDGGVAAAHAGDDDPVVADDDLLHLGALFRQGPVEVGDVGDHVLDGVAGHAGEAEDPDVGVEQVEDDAAPFGGGAHLPFDGEAAPLEASGEPDPARFPDRVEDVDRHLLEGAALVAEVVLQHGVEFGFGEFEPEPGFLGRSVDLVFRRGEGDGVGGRHRPPGGADDGGEDLQRPQRGDDEGPGQRQDDEDEDGSSEAGPGGGGGGDRHDEDAETDGDGFGFAEGEEGESGRRQRRQESEDHEPGSHGAAGTWPGSGHGRQATGAAGLCREAEEDSSTPASGWRRGLQGQREHAPPAGEWS